VQGRVRVELKLLTEPGRCTSWHKTGTWRWSERCCWLAQNAEAQGAGGWTPLHAAAYGGSAATIGSLSELGEDIHAVTEDGRTSLHTASSSEAVQSLLAAGAGLHRRDTCGATPLFEAARMGYVAAVTALVQAGRVPIMPATPSGGLS
jgi:ankyrin repeat protein